MPGAHGSPNNPLSGVYVTADGRYLAFVMLQPGKFWADVCHHIDHPELADDPRFATAELLAAHTEEAVKILRAALAGRTLAEWTERFATLAGPWAPVQDTLRVGADVQIRANEYLLRVGEIDLAASPVQFDTTAPHSGRRPSSLPRPRKSSWNWDWTGPASSS